MDILEREEREEATEGAEDLLIASLEVRLRKETGLWKTPWGTVLGG